MTSDDPSQASRAPLEQRPPGDPDEPRRRATDFLGRIAHEIRTPLTSILGFTELLIDEPGAGRGRSPGTELSPQERFEHLRAIQRNGRHLLELLGDLLDLSKLDAGRFELQPKPTRAFELIQEVVTLMRFRAERRGLKLSCHVQWPFPESIETDGLKLRQVLLNLVGNAVKFTQSGEVALRCQYIDANGKGHLQIQVEDSGPGIAPEHLPHLFEPFYQAPVGGPNGGTGLGLSIARGLIKALGGKLTVSSQIGVGSIFSVDLDLGPSAAIKLVPREPVLVETALPPAPSRYEHLGGQVLIVEDGADNQRLIRELLLRAGTRAFSANNGIEALELIFPRRGRRRGEAGSGSGSGSGSEAPAFDLILMDVEMPLMDGPTTVTELRRRGIKTPILVLTAHETPQLREELLALGANAVLHKPIDLGTFFTLLHRHMGRAA